MKLLLDENLPKRLKKDLSEHEASTVRDNGWNGKQNGELLSLLIENNFDALITFDKNLSYQQNFSKYPISVFVLHAPDNSYETLKSIIPVLQKELKSGFKKEVIPVSKRI